MKALRLQAVGKVALAEMDRPVPADDQLLVRTGAAAICTSDLNDIRANPFGIDLPVTLGHEGAGTVETVGPAVRGFAVGERVATHPVHPCGRCSSCRRGLGHLCLAMGHFGINMPGTFAEYYLVRQDRARRLPNDLEIETAVLAEPVAVCLEAIAQACLRPGDRLAVFGDGSFGIIICRLARGMGLGAVVLAGHHELRLRLARCATLNTATVRDADKAMLELAGNEGYDAAILATGNRAACSQALRLLRPKGRLVVFSAFPDQTPLDLFSVHVKELEIVGACNDQDRLDEAVTRLADASLGLAELITHRFPLDRWGEALDLARSGHARAVKVAFTFGSEARR